MRCHDPRTVWLTLAASAAFAAALFSLMPEIDLWVSGAFFRAGQGFLLTGTGWIELVRNLVWDLSIGVFLLALLGSALALTGRRLFGLAGRFWGFVSALYLIAPLALVNGLLKAHWGRARPANVDGFGGTAHFTPALFPTDQCAANCSFVSGEVSATVALSITMLLALSAMAHRLPASLQRLWLGLACLLPLGVALQRIASGRHFLSDTVFAAIITLAVAALLARLILGWRSGGN
ncbi:MAG: phosphatase PAP2 family protein [Paracoccaceae bacterium]